MADHLYRLPPDAPPPPPYALQVGLDWKDYHTPPHAGGLRDQPLQLLKDIRVALSTYNAIHAWRRAQNSLNAEGMQKFYSSEPELVKFMDQVWRLQDAEQPGD